MGSLEAESASPSLLTAKPGRSRELVGGLGERIALTLNVSSKCVTVDRWRFSGELPSILHCRGSSAGRRFFAKVFLADPYPIAPRIAVLWEDPLPSRQQVRSIEDQIATEWNVANQLRALAGPSYVPSPLAKSMTTRTIVWEEASGVRLDHLIARSRWVDRKGNTSTAALFQAGAWLRSVHDASRRGTETVDTSRAITRIRRLAEEGAFGSSRYANPAFNRAEAALMSIRGGKLLVPVALNHGDFVLPNVMWNRKLSRLFIFDFEHSGYRALCHDLVAMVLSLRLQFLNPLVPRLVILASEKSFWMGYGPVASEVSVFVSAAASAQILSSSRPHPSARRKRRGRLGAAAASFYQALFGDLVINRYLRSLAAGG